MPQQTTNPITSNIGTVNNEETLLTSANPLYSIEYPSYNSYNSILLHTQKRYQRERKGIAKDGRTQTEKGYETAYISMTEQN